MSYAVIWSEDNGPECAGSLELAGGAVRLSGTARDERHESRTLNVDDLSAVYLERTVPATHPWNPSLMLVDRFGRSVAIGSLQGLGALHELCDDLTIARMQAES